MSARMLETLNPGAPRTYGATSRSVVQIIGQPTIAPGPSRDERRARRSKRKAERAARKRGRK